jgi:hypothetical protein
MSNMDILYNGTQNERLFAGTILTMMSSQGFYCRLCETVNDLDEEGLAVLCETLNQQEFKDTLDVVIWLEC